MDMNKICPACHQPTMGVRYRRNAGPVHRCTRCGHKSGNKLPSVRIRYKVSGKVCVIPIERAKTLVRAGNAAFV